jgi:putative endonuclease
MAQHNDTGRRGEELARQYLRRCGYAILHQNWRHGHHEIDIIAVKDKVLHFVEVKTRRTERYGYPEAGVTTKKLHRLMRASGAFLRLHGRGRSAQCDIVAILLVRCGEPEFFLIEDVFT